MKRVLLAITIMSFLLSSFAFAKIESSVIKEYSLNDMGGIVSKINLEVDKAVSADGKGSIKITAEKPMTVKLYQTGDIDIENAQLVYKAKLKTKDVEGEVYLEMWCRFAGKGEFFSRGLQKVATGNSEWTTYETPFFLQKGENPEEVKLNIVINGKGTVWVDDIELLKAPLK